MVNDFIKTYFNWGKGSDDLDTFITLYEEYYDMVAITEKLQQKFAFSLKKKDFSEAAEVLPKILKFGEKKLHLEHSISKLCCHRLNSKKQIAELLKKDLKNIKKHGYKPVLY